MRLTVHNDACQTEGVLEDVNSADAEELRAELPLGWHFAEMDD